MNPDHYFALFPAYFTALLSWMMIFHYYKVGKSKSQIVFDKAWLEFTFSICAAVLTLLIGQLYINDLLLPQIDKWSILVESLNQILIFSPFLVLLFIRKQSSLTAWIPQSDKLLSIFLGLIIAVLSLVIFLLISGKGSYIITALTTIYSADNIPHLIQVFLEDLAIAICFVRFSALLGRKAAIGFVGILFAASHIPAMVSSGIVLSDFLNLILDSLLAVAILIVLSKTKNILWFWMVHFALDMTQFLE